MASSSSGRVVGGTIPQKEVTVFVLDTYSSMNNPYSSSSSSGQHQQTRLECAKEALESWISDLMIQSKLNEVGVVLLKTIETSHHLDEDDFPNLTFLPEGVVTRPTIQLLRRLQKVECSSQDSIRGDIMDGLVIAADALRRRTLGKRCNRSIVILTDASHEVLIQEKQVLRVVDSLREMDCKLHVIGLDFTESAIFDRALRQSDAAVENRKRKENNEEDDGTQMEESSNEEEDDNDTRISSSSTDNSGSYSDDDDEDDDCASRKRDTERFLISVARLTGGSVRAANSMKQMLEQNLGKRIPKSARKKCSFLLAPTIDPLDVRVYLILSKTNLPTLKREAKLLGEDGKTPLVDGLGNFVTSELETTTDHFDAVDKQMGVDETSRTRAVKYGSDWIPLNDFDLRGLKRRSDVNITVLGYSDQSNIIGSSRGLLMGPSYGVSPDGTSRRAEATLAALAIAMHRLSSCAICTYVKTQDADPLLTVLFPHVITKKITSSSGKENEDDKEYRLVLLQLPFCGDVVKLTTPSLEEHCTPDKKAVCDALIDSMMLPPSFEYSKIPNPAIRSFRKTVVQRAIHPQKSDTVVSARGEWFDVPASPTFQNCIKNLRTTFPIVARKKTTGRRRHNNNNNDDVGNLKKIYDPFVDDDSSQDTI